LHPEKNIEAEVKAKLRKAKDAILPGQDHRTAEIRKSDATAIAVKTELDAKELQGTKQPGTVPLIDDYRTVMVQRAIFQSLASMALPAFTIHSIVRYSGRALKNAKNVTIRTYGPIGLGLSAVPLLPFLFDKPVEEGVEWIFHKALGAKHEEPSEKLKEL
jgi:hypothetical protein